jgi:hypothetical protein
MCEQSGGQRSSRAVMATAAAAIAALGVAVLAGCAITPAGEDAERLRVGSPDFRAYVERVFREQNRVAGELGFALLDAELDADTPAVDRLDAAELVLLDACVSLNALATAQRDGEPLRRLAALRAARTAPECEVATANGLAVIDAYHVERATN